MSTRRASELTVLELKEKLKVLGLPTSGNKNELIIRLNETVPSGVWSETLPEEGAGIVGAASRAWTETRDSARELEVYLRDKYRMEAELDLLRRELELLRANSQPRINLTAIAELLAAFNGTTGDFETWERQLRLLKQTYRLDDEHVKILIGMRLKGKALDWLHSKPEFIEISFEALLLELKNMFHRPSRMLLRRKFEKREWKKGETFCEYVHEKVILGNRIPIDEEEMVEYIIDGIPDPILRDQARVSGLNSKRSLLEAFEKVVLWERKYSETKSD